MSEAGEIVDRMARSWNDADSMTATQAVPVSDIDSFSPEFLLDPYPAHETLREAGPVVRLKRYGIWASARHDPVRAALHDPVSFCSSAGVGMSDFRKETPWRPPSLLLEADPPAHTRARRVIAGVLSASAVRRLTDAFHAMADELVARLADGEPFDAMARLCVPYPLQVFSDAVGLPPEDRESLLGYARMVFNTFGPRNDLFTSAFAEAGATVDWVMTHTRRENLLFGGMGIEIHDRAVGEGFTPGEAGMLVRSFLSAGVDTTVHGLGNALFCLSTHPEQFAALHTDPGLARRVRGGVAVRSAGADVLPHHHSRGRPWRRHDPRGGEGAALLRRGGPGPAALDRPGHLRPAAYRNRSPRVRLRDPCLRRYGGCPASTTGLDHDRIAGFSREVGRRGRAAVMMLEFARSARTSFDRGH